MKAIAIMVSSDPTNLAYSPAKPISFSIEEVEAELPLDDPMDSHEHGDQHHHTQSACS